VNFALVSGQVFTYLIDGCDRVVVVLDGVLNLMKRILCVVQAELDPVATLALLGERLCMSEVPEADVA
jgi:hypothetical protein